MAISRSRRRTTGTAHSPEQRSRCSDDNLGRRGGACFSLARFYGSCQHLMEHKRPARESLLAELLAANGREYGFAAALGVLLLLNVTGVFRGILGLDTAI